MNHRPAKVFYLVDGLGIGGKTKALCDLALGLDQSRYQAVVYCFDEEGSPLAEKLRKGGIRVVEIPAKDGVDPMIPLRLVYHLRKERPQVVHCYNPGPILYGGLAARALGISATLGTLSAFACHVPDQDYEFLPQRLSTATRKNRLRNRLSSMLMGNLVTVAKSLGDRFCRWNQIDPAKMRIVPYGADVSLPWKVSDSEISELRRRVGCQPGDVLLGSVGRLVEQKDYPTQLRAFALALAQLGTQDQAPRARMVLAGAGPLESELRALCTTLGIAQQVHFLGHYNQVPTLLRAIDIFVLASKFEPYGVALLEAKGAALPIVSTRVNEIPEILSDQESGLLVEKENPGQMAEAFSLLIESPELRKRLGAEARREAEERHSLEAMISSYQGLYDTLQNQPSAPRRMAAHVTKLMKQRPIEKSAIW